MQIKRKDGFSDPDIAVMNTHFLAHPSFSVFRSEVLPQRTKIISIGSGADANFISSLMSLGVSGHLERRLSRPKDLVEIV